VVEGKHRGQIRFIKKVLAGAGGSEEGGVYGPLCMSNPRNSSKGIVTGRASVPTQALQSHYGYPQTYTYV
jgi:hypothetical protein